MTELNIAAINQLIEENPDDAIAALERVETVCVHDERMRSPLNVAIQSQNNKLVDLLLKHEDAIDYTPEPDPVQSRWLKHMVDEHFEETVDANEAFFSKYHKGEIYWQRSPLSQACRCANKHAIESLVKLGAKLDSVDALGYSAVELCLASGGEELVRFFVECCAAQDKKIKLTEDALRAIAHNTALYTAIINIADLDEKARKVKFNLACALLQYDEVKSMLEQGYDVNDSVVDDASPVAEVAFSNLVALLGHPEQPNLTKPNRRAFGDADVKGGSSELDSSESSKAKPIDLDEIAALVDKGKIDEVEKILREHDDAVVEQFVEGEYAPSDIDPQIESDELIDRRIKMLDLLASYKLDVKKAHEDANFIFTSSLLATNSPRLLDKLLGIGIVLDKEEMAEELVWGLQIGCFSIVHHFIELGYFLPEVEEEWSNTYLQYQEWLKR